MKKHLMLMYLLLMVAVPLISKGQSCTPADTYRQYLTGDGSGSAQTYKLVFEDQFNGTALNTAKWGTYYLGDSPPNDRTRASYGELQYYDDNNVVVQNGVVKFISEKVPVFNYAGVLRDLKSGMLYSKQQFLFGKFEMRCKFPVSPDGWIGPGYKPAFWLIGGCYGRDEIDIFEVEGRAPDAIAFSVHKQLDCTATNGGSGSNDCYGHDITEKKKSGLADGNFHTYSMEWTPDFITWSVDGVQMHTYGGWYTSTGSDAGLPPYSTGIYTRKGTFPELSPLNIIANLQILPGAGDPYSTNTIYPNAMDIDYIRVYQRAPSSQDLCAVAINGPGCVSTNTGQFTVELKHSASSVTWESSSNLSVISSTGNMATVARVPGASGVGWVRARVDFGNSACGIVYSPATAVFLDAPQPPQYSVVNYSNNYYSIDLTDTGTPATDYTVTYSNLSYSPVTYTYYSGSLPIRAVSGMTGPNTHYVTIVANNPCGSSSPISVELQLNGDGPIGEEPCMECRPAPKAGGTNVRELAITPNPASSSVQIQFGRHQQPATVSLVDLRGKTLETRVVTDSDKVEIDVSRLPEGMYMIRVTADNKTFNRKLLVKK